MPTSTQRKPSDDDEKKTAILYAIWKTDQTSARNHPLFPEFKHLLLCALCRDGAYECVVSLIEKDGASPVFYGDNALYMACLHNRYEVVAYLLKISAVCEVAPSFCNRSLLTAQAQEYDELATLLKSVPQVAEEGYDMDECNFGCEDGDDEDDEDI